MFEAKSKVAKTFPGTFRKYNQQITQYYSTVTIIYYFLNLTPSKNI